MRAAEGTLFLTGIVVLLALAGTASAATVGGGEVDLTVEGQRVGTQQSAAGAAGADAEAETKRVDLRAKGPMCDVELDARPTDSACSGPEWDVKTEAPTLNVDFFVGLGDLSQAPAERPSYLASVTGAAGPAAYSPRALLVATAAAGASAAALYAGWRLLKLLGLAGVVPLYSHITDDRLLDDPNRAAICDLVRQSPGVSTKEIADRLGLAWGTVTHHLAKLEKRRMVVSKKYGKYRRYFMNGAEAPADSGAGNWRDALAVLRVAKTSDVATFIRTHPGMTQKAVGEAMGVSSSTVLWHVKRLEAVGLVRKTRDGKTVRYFPGEAFRAGALGGNPAAPKPTAPAAPL